MLMRTTTTTRTTTSEYRWQGSELITILSIPIILLLYNIATVVNANYYLEDYTIDSYSADNDLDVRNVSCIAHDTKYTCDCQDINQKFELRPLSGAIYQIEIRNCKSLTIGAHVLKELVGLRKITFRNVHNLTLAKYALAFPPDASNTPLILTFEKVKVQMIDSHAINGHIEEIIFLDSQIDNINAFAFTILKEHAMLFKLERTTIKRIESQAFKKFLIEQIDIENCDFEMDVPSKIFYEVEVLNTLNINNVHFKHVHTRAFSFKMISKLIIQNNTFNGVDAEWLHVFVKDSILIRKNHFGRISPISFKGLQMHRKHLFGEKLELHFTNNTVYCPNWICPLEFNDTLILNLKHLQYDNQFACNELDYTKKILQPKSNFLRQHMDSIYFRTNKTKDDNFLVLSKIIEMECQLPVSYWLYILLGAIGIIVILIAMGMGLWCQAQKKQRKRLKLDIIQPEPRTYKETQIIYQIENAGLLKTDL